MSDLSDLLGAHRPDDTSNRQIALQTGLAPATIDKCMNGRHGKVEEPTLHALSEYFDIPLEDLRKAAGVPAGEAQPWTPPPEADRLNRRQRDALDEMIRSIVASSTSRPVGRDVPTDDTEDSRGVPTRWLPAEEPGVRRDENSDERHQLGSA